MSKKAQTPEVVIPTAAELGLEGAVAERYESLSNELKLNLVERLQEDRAATISNIEMGLALVSTPVSIEGVSFEETDFSTEEEPVYGPGDVVFQKGASVTAFFCGTVNTPTYDKITNWKSAKDKEGNTFYTNMQYRFQSMDGKYFRLWHSPMLSILQKVATHDSMPTACPKNPIVKLTYIGKIEGADEVKRITNMTLESGDSMHQWKVEIQAGAKIERFFSGCLNPLNSVYPVKKEGQKLDKLDQTQANFERLMNLQNQAPVVEQAQITQ